MMRMYSTIIIMSNNWYNNRSILPAKEVAHLYKRQSVHKLTVKRTKRPNYCMKGTSLLIEPKYYRYLTHSMTFVGVCLTFLNHKSRKKLNKRATSYKIVFAVLENVVMERLKRQLTSTVLVCDCDCFCEFLLNC